jgi:hypothetical protein
MNEPEFKSEKDLENAIALAIQSASGLGKSVVVLRGFGLDLAVFSETPNGPSISFFEIKAFSEDHGRCGFGSGGGEGNQIRLLFDETENVPRNSSELGLFDKAVRWVLGNRSAPIGSPRFLFLTCGQVQAAAMGGVRPGKQNNLNLSRLQDGWITWPVLIDRIAAFADFSRIEPPDRQ